MLLNDAGGGYFRLHPHAARDRALTVADTVRAGDSRIVLAERADRDQQLWKLARLNDGLFRISPKHAPGVVLDIHGAQSGNGHRIKLYNYCPSGPTNNAHAQRWVLVRVA